MENEAETLSIIWLQGSLWVVYAFAYGFYFGHVAKLRPADSSYEKLPGSPERLLHKRTWCFRFGTFIAMPTVLEMIHSSTFTSVMVTVMPCVFGIWVMRSVWGEVFRSKVPAQRPNGRLR